ncbi:glycoside hydrolase domain-containing protein, partial [Rathayibacter toxicus]|uniref:DUF1906 domain-containing protein n=1 Tax=Rathayibacter toxicus TaxID=145458 RepID=A0A2S5Y6X3_9MICO
MVDVWVQNAQKWVNERYGKVPGFTPAPTDGKAGVDTIKALTRALQHELGITDLSDEFGPKTFSILTSKYPTVSSTTDNDGIRGIVQAALWCKGFSGMAIKDGKWTVWDSTTKTSVANFRANMGFSAEPIIFPKLFKSLLTTHSAVAVSGGSALVRSIQQSLNGRYAGRQDYSLVPCDGVYSGDVQEALIYAVQYEVGLADGTANGFLGSATKAGLQSEAAHLVQGSTDSSHYFVHLFQAALTFNKYYNGPYDGIFSAKIVEIVKSLQEAALLPQTGEADRKTWASVLVSTGDSERMDSAKAVDCITTITTENAKTLKAAGYAIVGRYLTNTPNVDDPTDKNIKPGELATIFANDLSVFPIFQEGGTESSFFTYEKGKIAAERAHNAALSYGFLPGTTIYFAVDFDASEDDVYSNIVPFFQGIKDKWAECPSLGQYKVGIYGVRNACSIVSEKGLASLSYVSDMSYTWRGNIGFTLPKNWAFDQIKEYPIGSGDGKINIDKNIVSGRDSGQKSVKVPQ